MFTAVVCLLTLVYTAGPVAWTRISVRKWMDGIRMDGWMDSWIENGWMDGIWMDGKWMNGKWMDG